jgi:sulfoacetaldehyde dehydrogenase
VDRPRQPETSARSPAAEAVAALVARARTAQAIADAYDQARVDELVAAAGWAILESGRNRALAELAVRDTGIGDVEDKVLKNHRKTLGLLRDLHGMKTVGVISEDKASGIVEIARPAGVVCAVTPSTNPAATPANKIINSLKARNAVIVAPSPKGASTCAALIGYIHAQFDRIGAPRDLVQMLPAPITKDATGELMRQCDLVVATGSQANVRAAYASGTPAFGVGAGNVASIIDETADVGGAAAKIVQSKTFDNATSCSSENSVILVEAIADAMIAALVREGCVLVDADDRARLEQCMWPDGKLSPGVIGQPVSAIAQRAALANPAARSARVLMIEDADAGPGHPFSGEKLSPILTVYRVPDFEHAKDLVRRIYAFQGAGHSVSLHTGKLERAIELGLTLPVARVIPNQVHVVANGGSFSNGLPVSLSMGCGTWGKNNFSENLSVRHYMNVTRVAFPIPERVPSVDDVLGDYLGRWGRH